MIGQRDHKKENTDTPKASLGKEMDVWDAGSKFWYERHNEGPKKEKEPQSKKPPSGDHATAQKTGFAGKPKILISLRTSSKNCCLKHEGKNGPVP